MLQSRIVSAGCRVCVSFEENSIPAAKVANILINNKLIENKIQ